MKEYDYIIAGAGASGLSLLVHMLRSGQFAGKRILIVDREQKVHNDRTWCFWETHPGPFEEIVYRSWKSLRFVGDKHQEIVCDISPYTYKLIRGIDFYDYCLRAAGNRPKTDFVYGVVTGMRTHAGRAEITVNRVSYSAEYIFNSIPFEKPPSPPSAGTYSLQQHFKGWFIRSADPAFSPSLATLMDFRTSQEHGTSFFYVMPFSNSEALVEYTLFSANLLQDEEYESALHRYCSEKLGLRPGEFEIMSKETGCIPMTTFPFPRKSGNIINIGTAGGHTRPSTGYTFRFIQKNSAAVTAALAAGQDPAIPSHGSRHLFYDGVLLNILSKDASAGAAIFTRLFTMAPMRKIFRFLDGDSTLLQDLQIISRLPIAKFSRAALDHITKKNLQSR